MFQVLCNYFMTTFLNSRNYFRLWYYFTSSTSIISVSVTKNEKTQKTIIATTTTGDYKTANQYGWLLSPIRSVRYLNVPTYKKHKYC